MFSSGITKNKKDQEKSSLKDQSNSTLIDTSQSEPTKTLELINQFQNNNSKQKFRELEDIDLSSVLLFLSSLFLFCIHVFNAALFLLKTVIEKNSRFL